MNRKSVQDVGVAVIGAGIGGLACGIALVEAGQDVHVFEQAEHLQEVGGAIVARMGSAALLDSWDLLDGFFSTAVQMTCIEFFDETGRHTGSGSFPADPSEQVASATFGIHRADLHGLLRGGFPNDRLHLSRRVSEIRERDSHVEVNFQDGSTVRAGVLVGADGIRSAVRRECTDLQPHYAGLVVCRGVVPAQFLPEGMPNDRMRMWSKDNRTIMAVPMRAGREFAIDTVVFRDEAPADLWTSVIDTDELLEGFSDFDDQVTSMVRQSRVPIVAQGVHEIEPFTPWCTRRIALLGDAAHAMNPSHGQGANSAIQDAGALARHLADPGFDTAKALHAYEAERQPITAALQLQSRVRPATPEVNA